MPVYVCEHRRRLANLTWVPEPNIVYAPPRSLPNDGICGSKSAARLGSEIKYGPEPRSEHGLSMRSHTIFQIRMYVRSSCPIAFSDHCRHVAMSIDFHPFKISQYKFVPPSTGCCLFQSASRLLSLSLQLPLFSLLLPRESQISPWKNSLS